MSNETQLPGAHEGAQPRRDGKEITAGIISCFALNLLQVGVAFELLITAGNHSDVAAAIAYPFIGWLGLLQLTYVIPLFLALRKKGRPNFAKGLFIGASFTFLLNATCWGYVMTANIKDL
jgi:hypothetical protein